VVGGPDITTGSEPHRCTAAFRLKVNGYKVPHRINHRGITFAPLTRRRAEIRRQNTRPGSKPAEQPRWLRDQ